MELYLIRHAHAVDGDGLRDDDRPLSREGRRQALEVGSALARQKVRVQRIVTSPLVRARQSAEIIAAGLGGGVPIREDPQIAEVEYGRWEGMTYEDLIVDEDYLRYREEPILSSTPGGECIEEVRKRGVEAVMRTLGEADGQRVLFVSHGDIIRTILCHFLAMEFRHFRRIRVDNAALSAVQVAGEFAEVKFLNIIPDIGRAFVAPFPVKPSADSPAESKPLLRKARAETVAPETEQTPVAEASMVKMTGRLEGLAVAVTV